jgi:hypothetical protein
MIKPHYILNAARVACFFIAASVLTQCTETELTSQPVIVKDVPVSAQAVVAPQSCEECTYVVPSSTGTQVIDGVTLGIKPGSVICLSAANNYVNILFRNIIGTGAEPIIITNCGGTAYVNGTGKPYTVKTEMSKFFRIKGGTGSEYGIKLTGGHMGLTLEKLSTNFEVNNIEVYNVGFAGIMAKTDPTCDDATIRGNFVMRNVTLHDNYVHDTGGEAFYIGNSFYETGMTRECGQRLPHTIDGLKIYNNRIDRSGWEAIQVGCAINGAHVFKNRIENYGYANETYQNNGIQFSQGTKAICYRNFIKDGPGMGINVVGHGDALLHDNIIVNTGSYGIFCDERNTRDLPGFQIVNNTIVNPGLDGIRMYNEYVPGVIYNNIIANPGNYTKYVYPRTSADAYIYKINKYIPLQAENNLLVTDVSTVLFRDASNTNFRLKDTSPARDQGRDVSAFDIAHDHYGVSRLKGAAYDIGAAEY